MNHSVREQPATDLMSKNSLRAIFGMRLRTWPDGSPIRVYVLPDRHPLHTRFCKNVLEVFPHQLRVAWDRLIYSGTGQAPTEIESESEMRTRIASTPGAIGYSSEALADDRSAPAPSRTTKRR